MPPLPESREIVSGLLFGLTGVVVFEPPPLHPDNIISVQQQSSQHQTILEFWLKRYAFI
jgi:hypothetical protein